MTSSILYASFNIAHIGLPEKEKHKMFNSFYNRQKQRKMANIQDPNAPAATEEVVDPVVPSEGTTDPEATGTDETGE